MTLRNELAHTKVELTDLSPLQRWFLGALAEQRNQAIIDASDVEKECPHGWLPRNKDKATCDCWRTK